jgi:hypothetical protein
MAKRPDLKQDLERIFQSDGARSKAARWMMENHDWFFERLERFGANWDRITETFIRRGWAEPGTKPMTLKRMWHRVHKRVMERRANQPQVTDSAPPAPHAEPKPQTHVQSHDADEDDIEFPELKPRDWTKGEKT